MIRYPGSVPSSLSHSMLVLKEPFRGHPVHSSHADDNSKEEQVTRITEVLVAKAGEVLEVPWLPLTIHCKLLICSPMLPSWSR